MKSREQMIKDGELECDFIDDITELSELLKFLVKTMFCFNKDLKCFSDPRRECPYLKQYQDAKRASIVIGMHSHLSTHAVEYLNKDLLVIDENFLSHYRQEIIITEEDISFTQQVLADMPEDDLVRRFLIALRAIQTRDVLPSDSFKLEKGSKRSFNAKLAESIMKAREQGLHGRLLLDDIEYLTESGEKIRHKNGKHCYHRTSYLPNKKIIVLDATMSKEMLQTVTGRNVKEFDLSGYDIEQHSKVIQVVGGNYGVNSIVKNKKMGNKNTIDGILRKIKILADGRSYCIISHKQFIDQQKLVRKLGENRVGWFNNVRGLNHFKDAEVLFVVGFPMIPFDEIVRQTRILFRQDWDDEEEVERMRKDKDHKVHKPINLKCEDDKLYYVRTVPAYSFSNPYIQLFFDCFIRAEYEQAIGRARVNEPLKSGKTQEVYIICDQPTEFVRIDQVVDGKDIAGDPRKISTRQKISDAIKILQEQGIKITPKNLKSVCDIALRTIQRHYKSVLEEQTRMEHRVENGFVFCRMDMTGDYDGVPKLFKAS
ncbi:MAG: hypothetical protein HPY52_16520 [Firmicutes bacterium]|nr:hypothetical protein [Bacillota bacterium]